MLWRRPQGLNFGLFDNYRFSTDRRQVDIGFIFLFYSRYVPVSPPTQAGTKDAPDPTRRLEVLPRTTDHTWPLKMPTGTGRILDGLRAWQYDCLL